MSGLAGKFVPLRQERLEELLSFPTFTAYGSRAMDVDIKRALLELADRRRLDTPRGAVSVVKPQGTEETGEDRPAAPMP